MVVIKATLSYYFNMGRKKKAKSANNMIVLLVVVVGLVLFFVLFLIRSTQTQKSIDSHEQQASPTVSIYKYSIKELGTHNNKSDCWTTINGKVYVMTDYLKKHPGGADPILRVCGTDGSAMFDKKHGGQSRIELELNKYYLGELVNK